jgi:glucose/arabinose dehydrogenase
VEQQSGGTGAVAAAATSWPKVRLRKELAGLERPVAITGARDGSGRLFVCERDGRVRTVADGALSPQPFLDITDRVGRKHNEQGFLSICFPPDFGTRQYFYACYTDTDNDVIVSRFPVRDERGDADGEEAVLGVWHPYRNHNGGQLAFGPDGYLYVGVGDGGSEYDPNGYGQNAGVALGKILRIDTESVGGRHEDGDECDCTYHVPEDNPFYDNPAFVAETWHWGLRNPWRFSFDRETGDMYIGDVGQDSWEEIDFAAAGVGGLNFGWSLWEGTHHHPADGLRSRHTVESLGEADLVPPVAEYSHAEDGGMAVMGGYVYRGQRFPELRGVYFFADYGSGKLSGLRRDDQGAWQHTVLAETGLAITSFGEDDDGEIHVCDFRGGLHALEKA